MKLYNCYNHDIKISNFVNFFNCKYGHKDFNKIWLLIQRFATICYSETIRNIFLENYGIIGIFKLLLPTISY